MNAGPVGASILLASFLVSEHEKIGQEISQSDFAVELGKLLSPRDTVSPVSAQEPAGNETPVQSPVGAASQSTDLNSSIPADAIPAQATGRASAGRHAEACRESKARIQNLKTRTKNSEALYITNSALAESILAKMHYPADAIKAFKSLQNKDGWIPLAEFKTLLANPPDNSGAQGSAAVSSADAQALLAAVVRKIDKSPGSAGSKTSGELAKTRMSKQGAFRPALSKAQLQLASGMDGSCSAESFGAVIEQVLQKADGTTAGTKTATAGSGSPAVASVASASSSAGAEITGTTVIAPKKGQAGQVTANKLPSFIRDDEEEGGADGAGAESPGTITELEAKVNWASRAHIRANREGANRTADAENRPGADKPAESAASRPLASDTVGNAAKVAREEVLRQSTPIVEQAYASGGSKPIESNPLSETAALTDTDSNAADLASTRSAQNFAAAYTEAGKIEQPLTADAVANIAGAPENTGYRVWNIAPLAMDTGLIKDGESSKARPLNDPRLSISIDGETLGDMPEVSRVPEPHSAEGAGSEDRTLYEGNSNHSGSSADNSSEGKQPGRKSIDAAVKQALGDIGSKYSVLEENRPPGVAGNEKTSGSPSAFSMNSPVDLVDEFPGRQVRQNSTTAANDLLRTGSTSAGARETRALSNEAIEIEQQITASSEASSGKPLNGHDVVMLSQQAEKQLKTRDSLPDPLNLQAAGHQFHNARIEMPGMEQSPDSGLHYYDPARSAELVEQYKEHSRSIGGHELVLEMDQGEFGKMSIKVGTRNDEVSAVVVTESEPARHALLKNSPELRQELQDQGLLLGKFQVDVDRDRSGRENSHQGQGQEGNRQARDAPSESTAVKSKVGRPSYVRNNGTLSQVSIFA